MAISDVVKDAMVSYLYGTFLWAARISSPSESFKQFQKEASDYDHEHLGLTSLAYAEDKNPCRGTSRRILPSCMRTTKKSSLPSSSFFSGPSSSSWTSSANGDLIGTESGVHMTSSEDVTPWENAKPYTSKQSSRGKILDKKGDIPPPITILRGRGDYTGPSPWCLTREYVDGRLILREARVKHFEYLESNRHNGRLVMNLVQVDNTANCFPGIAEENGREIQEDGLSLNGNENEKAKPTSGEREDIVENGKDTSFAASLPDSTVENELKFGSENFRRCVTYAEGLAPKNFFGNSSSRSPLISSGAF